jgi:hypothetical protein
MTLYRDSSAVLRPLEGRERPQCAIGYRGTHTCSQSVRCWGFNPDRDALSIKKSLNVLKFLHATHFPPVERHGQRGKTFVYPEWLIMLIGVLAVTCKEPTYLGIHRMTCWFWHELWGARGTYLRSPKANDGRG